MQTKDAALLAFSILALCGFVLTTVGLLQLFSGSYVTWVFKIFNKGYKNDQKKTKIDKNGRIFGGLAMTSTGLFVLYIVYTALNLIFG